MCLICVEFQKQKMTVREARNAFREMVVDMDREHASEVEKMLQTAEIEALKKSIQALPQDEDD